MTEDDNDFQNRSNDPLRVFLHSHSAIRTGTHHYRFYLNLDATYDTYDIYFQIRKIQCSYSWYNITAVNNRVDLNGDTYSLPPGNYSASSLVDALNAHGDWGEKEITWNLNLNTGKITVSAESGFSWEITTTLHPLLGFSSIPSGTHTSYTSDQLVDVTPIKAINFHLLSVPSRSFAIYSGQEISRHLCTLFVGQAEPFTTLQNDDETVFKESSLQHKLRSVEFTIYDQDGLPVDLQNGSFQVLLEFTFRPKKVWRLFFQ